MEEIESSVNRHLAELDIGGDAASAKQSTGDDASPKTNGRASLRDAQSMDGCNGPSLDEGADGLKTGLFLQSDDLARCWGGLAHQEGTS